MSTEAYKVVEKEMMFLGDILCIGILKRGLSKVGSTPDHATPEELSKALDVHVEPALVSFIGPVEARKRVLKMKSLINKNSSGGGAQ